MSAVINFTLLSAATARSSARTSCRKTSRSFSRSPSTVKLFPVEKRSWTTALAAISPLWSNLAHGKEKAALSLARETMPCH
jgi:hypothetical protein